MTNILFHCWLLSPGDVERKSINSDDLHDVEATKAPSTHLGPASIVLMIAETTSCE